MTSPLQRLAVHCGCGVALAALLTASVDATTLAIIRTGNEIVIAADSLMTLYGHRPQLTCKIRRQGNVVFATAGLVSTSGGVSEFHTVITNILRRRLPWPEQARQVEEWLKEPLLRTLRRMERGLPDEFHAQFRQGFTLHVSLAGIHDGGPRRSRFVSTSSSVRTTGRCGCVSSDSRAPSPALNLPRSSESEKRTR